MTTNPMPDVKRKSSCVAGMEYNPASMKLTVFYTNMTTYDYDNVPPYIYTGLLCAESKGQYLNANVKGIYNYIKRQP